MKSIYCVGILALSGCAGLLLSLYVHRNDGASSGPINLMPTFHSPALFVQQIAHDPNAGEKIFKEFCGACHANKPVIHVPAPRIGNRVVWRGLRKLGREALLEMTIRGGGAMPARGGCFECSDAQLQQAIDYMICSH